MTFDPLLSLSVHVSDYLAGSKRAVRQGSRLYVSPAMYDLISHAESEDEFKRLLEAIECITIPEMPSMFDFVPMTTRAWE